MLDLDSTRRLLFDWFVVLGLDRGWNYGSTGRSNEDYRAGSADHTVLAKLVDEPPFLEFVAQEKSRQEEVNEIVVDAIKKSRSESDR